MKPLKILPLWDIMKEYDIFHLSMVLTTFTALLRDLGNADKTSSKICSKRFLNELAMALEEAGKMAQSFEADPSLLGQIAGLELELKMGKADSRESVIFTRLHAIRDGLENNLEHRKFMFITSDQATYWNNPKLFGRTFISSFSSAAKFELVEMGNCYAAARWTACVYHSMRLAEYGLRKLARKLHVKITDKKKPCPIEYGDWNKVITAIRSKIAKTREKPQGPQKENMLQFYSAMADQCEYIKDIWRNELAHTRRTYNKQEALGAINRVKEFVKELAES